MTGPSEPNGQEPKLLAGGAIKLRIALASVAILAVGWWLTPRAAQTTLTTPQERAAPLLEEQVQLRQASRTFVGVQDIASHVLQHGVAIQMPAPADITTRSDFSERGGLSRLGGFGVFISDTHVLTHSAALDGRSSVRLAIGNGEVTSEARVVAYEPPTGLVLLETEPSGRPAPVIAAGAPAAGALAVGVGRSAEGDIAVPVFVTSAGAGRYGLGGASGSLLPGMPVFNATGELLAVAAPDGAAMHAIPVRAAADRLLARVARGERRTAFGLSFQAHGGLLTRTFGEDGVVITDVLEGGPADLADVQVGDVLLAIGEVQVDSAETAMRALSSAAIGGPARLRMRRGGRVRDIEAMPALAYEVAALARARPDAGSGIEARALLPAAVLEQSAIPPSARVISLGGRAVASRAEVQRVLRGARGPLAVLLRQGNTRFFVAIEPEK